MRLFLLTALTMAAFAANSVLTRAGVHQAGLDAVWFGVVRLCSGAAMLGLLALVLRGGLPLRGKGRLAGVAGLLVYIFGFSLAYVRLDSGVGALILFGMVQLTMFAGVLAQGTRPPPLRWIGAALALGGLAWLLWPGAGVSLSLPHGAAMALAGIGWGAYSLAGRGARDALGATAANFVIAAPLALALALLLPAVEPVDWPVAGLLLAVLSGAVTSGLGYALWYAILPRLDGSVAAVAQLTVPLIAMAGGMALLSEPLTTDFLLAAALVLGGVGLSLIKR